MMTQHSKPVLRVEVGGGGQPYRRGELCYTYLISQPGVFQKLGTSENPFILSLFQPSLEEIFRSRDSLIKYLLAYEKALDASYYRVYPLFSHLTEELLLLFLVQEKLQSPTQRSVPPLTRGNLQNYAHIPKSSHRHHVRPN